MDKHSITNAALRLYQAEWLRTTKRNDRAKAFAVFRFLQAFRRNANAFARDIYRAPNSDPDACRIDLHGPGEV